MLNDQHIEFIGEIDDGQKKAFLGEALALLFPIDWPEPFGLAMVESMSSGTPVIAWDKGSVSEIVDNGQSGMIVQSIGAAVDAVEQIHHINRRSVRRRFEARFTVARMAANYIKAYEYLLAGGRGLDPEKRQSAEEDSAAWF